jgi:hypothetical protein
MHHIQSRWFPSIWDDAVELLLTFGETIDGSTRWQGQDVAGKQDMVPVELQNVIFEMSMPHTVAGANRVYHPNLPWAEDHFLERVGGAPLNPPPSAKTWPFAQSGHVMHTDKQGQFSHTYPERFWPKHAGHSATGCNAVTHEEGDNIYCDYGRNIGVRYYLGDLIDVVDLLRREPSTRQAYLPIWFPEDTGAAEGQRVPCSLGYHFMVREGKLNITYMIRAVDFMRHFRDDVYMATRLAQWVARELDNLYPPGMLTMHIMSLHCFVGDMPALRSIASKIGQGRSERLLGAMR